MIFRANANQLARHQIEQQPPQGVLVSGGVTSEMDCSGFYDGLRCDGRNPHVVTDLHAHAIEGYANGARRCNAIYPHDE